VTTRLEMFRHRLWWGMKTFPWKTDIGLGVESIILGIWIWCARSNVIQMTGFRPFAPIIGPLALAMVCSGMLLIFAALMLMHNLRRVAAAIAFALYLGITIGSDGPISHGFGMGALAFCILIVARAF
jgi:hypothetical protein